MPRLVRVDYADARQARALVELLDLYARDPAGGGQPLSEAVKAALPAALAGRPQAFSVLAFDDEASTADPAVGLVNCFEGFSTFAARALVNVHDVIVRPTHRGRGLAALMLAEVEAIARERGACKLTLEVLSGNRAARRVYVGAGFVDYQLDPAFGRATFMQKVLGDG